MLWHKRMGHLHHKALPILWEIVIGLPEFKVEQHGVWRGSKEILDQVTEDEEKEALKAELRS
jgi:hypothetical protein